MNVRGGRGGPGAGEECDEDDDEDYEEREAVTQVFHVSRLPPISGYVPETSRRKVKKKKKKKKSSATGLGKGSGKGSSKDPSSKLESMKEVKREKEENKHPSCSSSAEVEESLSTKINESLRWEGILEDPVAEEERIHIYKLNRRKRYRLSALEGFCPTPSVLEGINENVSVLPDPESCMNSKQQAMKVDCPNCFLDGNMTSKILPSPELATANVSKQKLSSALANLS
ncbi:protein LIAT1 isoform X3 [Phascolarctos cinereus]|uniref:Protein LIAT1 isoform X3 n=1 Tax=Phascolarctos cinereus TaxID=38626 RepID=A0A6P5M347_PHACI|nr:protein LIAT1 isoform X3 [Phascolarctos cinereus]